jgi:hypothetical protein
MGGVTALLNLCKVNNREPILTQVCPTLASVCRTLASVALTSTHAYTLIHTHTTLIPHCAGLSHPRFRSSPHPSTNTPLHHTHTVQVCRTLASVALIDVVKVQIAQKGGIKVLCYQVSHMMVTIRIISCYQVSHVTDEDLNIQRTHTEMMRIHTTLTIPHIHMYTCTPGESPDGRGPEHTPLSSHPLLTSHTTLTPYPPLTQPHLTR